MGKHPNDWKKKPSKTVTVGNHQAGMSIPWGCTKICDGSDSSSRVSLKILVTEQENLLKNCIYDIKQREIQVL